jgi:hypothetical protein
MDVITAFLNGIVTENIYMETPAGFEGYGDKGKVVKLNKALYGLKQAPKVWYEHIDTWLTNQGLTRSFSDPNLYYSLNDKGQHTIILLYVDDLLITGDDEANIQLLQSALIEEFEMIDLGASKQYLGAEFQYHSDGIWVHQ